MEKITLRGIIEELIPPVEQIKIPSGIYSDAWNIGYEAGCSYAILKLLKLERRIEDIAREECNYQVGKMIKEEILGEKQNHENQNSENC